MRAKVRTEPKKMVKSEKTWSMTKKGPHPFGVKMLIFSEKTSFRNLGPRNIVPSPELGTRSPPLPPLVTLSAYCTQFG